MKKKGILLVNLGTPDSTSVKDVRKYLREFLMDKRVIDIPFLGRWLLVNLIIAIFRAPKSSREYRKLFTDRGSPLKFNTEDLTAMVRRKIPGQYTVEYAMRYQSPSIKNGLERLQVAKVSEIQIIPLFPQYASATTGSVVDKVMEVVSGWQVIPKISFVSQFFDHPLYIETIADQARRMMDKKAYDHFVFSYHGLPERQILKASVNGTCELNKCCTKYDESNQYCYRAQCFATTRLIAESLGLQEKDYSICFQSRLGKAEWIKPYAEDTLKQLAKTGKKNVLALSPAFVSDCLETTIEVGETYRDEFLGLGGSEWDLVPSLNVEQKWVECIVDMTT